MHRLSSAIDHRTGWLLTAIIAIMPCLLPQHATPAIAGEPTPEFLWRTGPNLVPDGDFARRDHWRLIDPRNDEDDPYPALRDSLPTAGQTIIYRQPLGNGRSENVLASCLSGRPARGKIGVCESSEIPAVPDMQYRLEFRCRSAGPRPTVIVRGFATVREENGQPALREVRQWRFVSVNPARDEWTNIREEFTTENSSLPIRALKLELGGQGGGYLFFDKIILKAVGRPSMPPKPATTRSTTRP